MQQAMLPVLIAWFIPAHLVAPTLPSLQMITVQNHLRLQNPAQSILFSPASQGCKKYTYQLFSLLLYIFKLDLGMTIYYSACYGLPKINDFLTQTFRLSKPSFHTAWGKKFHLNIIEFQHNISMKRYLQ